MFMCVIYFSFFHMIKLYNEEFTNLEEFRLFCRRADKLLPATLAEIDEFVSSCNISVVIRDAYDLFMRPLISLLCIFTDRLLKDQRKSSLRCVMQPAEIEWLLKLKSK